MRSDNTLSNPRLGVYYIDPSFSSINLCSRGEVRAIRTWSTSRAYAARLFPERQKELVYFSRRKVLDISLVEQVIMKSRRISVVYGYLQAHWVRQSWYPRERERNFCSSTFSLNGTTNLATDIVAIYQKPRIYTRGILFANISLGQNFRKLTRFARTKLGKRSSNSPDFPVRLKNTGRQFRARLPESLR